MMGNFRGQNEKEYKFSKLLETANLESSKII